MTITEKYDVKEVCPIHGSDFWTSTFRTEAFTVYRCVCWKLKQPGVPKGQEIILHSARDNNRKSGNPTEELGNGLPNSQFSK